MRTPEQYARYLAECKAKRDAAAIADGRVPGKRGRPFQLTEEERREKRRIKSAKWREANRERSREITRESMKRASDAKATAAGRAPGTIGRPATPISDEERRAKQNERVKRYYAEHPEASRRAGALAARNRRARLRNAPGEHTARDLTFLRFVQRDRCLFCGEPLGPDTPHVDHFVPLIEGGGNGLGNLRLLHEVCNLRKGATHPHPADRALTHGTMDW